MSYHDHPDHDVRFALNLLCVALSHWERTTGRTSALVLRESGGFVFRAADGRPVPDDSDVSDETLFQLHAGG